MNEKKKQYFCRLCGDQKAKPFLKTFDHYSPKNASFQLYQCESCSLLFVKPLPDPIKFESSFPEQVSNPFLYFQNTKKDFLEKIYTFFHPYSLKWRIKQVEKVKGTGRLLDVRCGNGDFLYEMRQKLWEVVGVESKTEQANFVRNTLGLQVYEHLEDMLFEKYQNSFDVITFWHSLGYFDDFNGILKLVSGLLKHDGVILLAMPNWHSPDFWFYRQNWAAFDIPRRLYYFGPRQVQILMRKHQLRLIISRVIPFDIYYNCFLSERIIIDNLKMSRIHRLFRYSWALFFAIIVQILSISGAGSGMLYFVRRKNADAK